MSVITCPGPGSGKTVLLRSWIGQAGAAGLSERVARVPAGRDERDPQRFWLSVLAALRQTAPRTPLVRARTRRSRRLLSVTVEKVRTRSLSLSHPR